MTEFIKYYSLLNDKNLSKIDLNRCFSFFDKIYDLEILIPMYIEINSVHDPLVKIIYQNKIEYEDCLTDIKNNYKNANKSNIFKCYDEIQSFISSNDFLFANVQDGLDRKITLSNYEYRRIEDVVYSIQWYFIFIRWLLASVITKEKTNMTNVTTKDLSTMFSSYNEWYKIKNFNFDDYKQNILLKMVNSQLKKDGLCYNI